MFQEIWNEFRGVKQHSDFSMNHSLGKRGINNKLFIYSVKIHKDFFKLIYIITMGYELLENVKVEELKNSWKYMS